MYDKTLLRPTITLCTLLFASVLLFGCTDADLLAPEHEAVTAADAATNNSVGVQTETADVFGQGPDGDIVAEDGATLRRTPNGISVKLQMPTPEPGTYTYPSGPEGGAWTDEEGPPEAFTLWAFVFNNPEECEHADGEAPEGIECGSGDLGERAGGGAFFVAGHLFGGPNLTLSGHISKNTEVFQDMGVQLEKPKEAEVHLAVAPHGALDSDLLPEQIQTATGPGPDIWWLALFE